MIPKKAVEEFKQLYKEKYSEELNDFVATEAANRLVCMMDVVYRPIPKEWNEQHDKIKAEQEAVPDDKKVDFVKHLVDDAKVTEFREQIGEKEFWNLVREANAAQKKADESAKKD